MIRYKRIYCEAFGYDPERFIPSEVSGFAAVDVHHIDCKGMGGDPTGSKDRIENLIAVTRREHEEYGDKKQYMKFLYETHKEKMIRVGVKFDREYMNEKINKYS